MGIGASRFEKDLLSTSIPESERFYGLENFGNTCYCNSVLQALYHCIPFRNSILEYYYKNGLHLPQNRKSTDNLFLALADLFVNISQQKKRTGVVPPRKGHMHQDAHEFLNFLMNSISEHLGKMEKKKMENSKATNSKSFNSSNQQQQQQQSTKNEEKKEEEIFEGILTNETKCLTCESITSKDESFLDLSIDIQQNTSITSCLSNFSSVETLSKNDKFFCDKCISLQEAQKRMKIKKLPNTLIIHLKRFKFVEQYQQFQKLNYRVVFPFEIIIQNTTNTIEEPDKKYHLFAVVIHAGNGPNHGHYTSMVKSNGHWIGFDDENMGIIPESDIFEIFGSQQELVGRNECGYLLFYQTEESLNEKQFKSPVQQNSSYASTLSNLFYG
ncbi:peptidase C19 family protein [Cavenderia fasciculata]|uniref:Ubiquitin carboxyl-terminal hydrolase n=1 Tax=Cavenderia fasciculata TaxID=261658 RepID=F4PG80_CACFS|nr:peptidase C19 family protein [Cavenderia fasciculata]EGG24714.1 peptidase C19 family protein [Cavenderia fasciculata]|eukprot:XP_004362565.1 peptidase C19 family protein [Cavenderia fasciculata]